MRGHLTIIDLSMDDRRRFAAQGGPLETGDDRGRSDNLQTVCRSSRMALLIWRSEAL
jgi:hypothetical protein